VQRLQTELRQKVFQLEWGYNLLGKIGSTFSYKELFRSILTNLNTLIPCEVSGGILVKEKSYELFLNSIRYLSTSAQQEIQERLIDDIGKVNNSQIIGLPFCWHYLNFIEPKSTNQPLKKIGSYFLVPIITNPEVDKEIIGFLFVGAEEEEKLTEEHLGLLYAIANQVSIYVQQLGLLLEAEKNKLENERIRQALTREKELNELKTRIVRTISHEYRTPLTIISLAIDLLESQNGRLNEEQKQICFRQIRTATQHMVNLVEDALIVNQAESDEIEFNPSYINIVNLCQQLVSNFQLNINEQQKIIFINENCPEQVYLDQTLVYQILSNLLSNAIKYSPNGGLINFQLTSNDEKICFEIQDRGIGIPPEEQSHIFECFHRATNVGTLSGTGLGLTIVKKCVDIHRGEVSFQSTLNLGTTFIVKLPLLKPNQE
jgi:signal transduction histidine kinase